MNYLKTLALTLGFAALNLHAQQPCTVPVSNSLFQQRVNQVKVMQDHTRRLATLKQFVGNQCFSSGQVKQLLLLLLDDQDKLALARQAYPKITDKENFYDLYDAFGSLSMVMRLHDYYTEQRRGVAVPVPIETLPPPPPPTQGITFPNLPYPSPVEYLGRTMCMEPMSHQQFESFATAIYKLSGDANRMHGLRSNVVGKCASVGQVMRFATLLQSESLRLEFLKAMYPSIYDIDQYNHAEYLFTLNNLRQEFTRFISGQPGGQPEPPQPPVPACEVSAGDMAQIISSLKNVSFESTRMTQAKSIVATKKCFTVSQIIEIIRLFSFENSKLDFAKYAYDYCTNKSDYFRVSDEFSFDSSKRDLSSYIQTRK